jgi:predicted nucleic acid-binding protein
MSGNFADSNVLLYISAGDTRKADIAERLLDDGLSISVQVLNEIANVVVKKWRQPWSDADELLELIRRTARIVPLTEETHQLGVSIARRHQLAVYDSMIVAAALLDDCDTLYTQDMHHGLRIEGRLTVVNPFLAG